MFKLGVAAVMAASALFGSEGGVVAAEAPAAYVQPIGQRIEAVAFAPNGRWLAFTTGNAISLWDLDTGGQVWRTEVKGDLIRALAFSPDSAFLASGGEAANLAWLSVTDGTTRWAKPTGYGITSLAVSKDGQLVSAGIKDGHIVVFNATSGESAKRLKPHRYGTADVHFLADGRLLSAGVDQFARISDLTSSGKPQSLSADIQGERAHVGILNTIAVSDDGRWAATGAYWNGAANLSSRRRDGRPPAHDATFRLWDFASGKPQGQISFPWGVTKAAFISDRRVVALVMVLNSPFSNAYAVSLPDLKSEAIYRSGSTNPGLTALAVSPDERWIVLGTTSGTIRILSAQNFQPIAELAATAAGTITLAPDGRHAVTGSAPAFQSDASRTEGSCLLPETLQRECKP